VLFFPRKKINQRVGGVYNCYYYYCTFYYITFSKSKYLRAIPLKKGEGSFCFRKSGIFFLENQYIRVKMFTRGIPTRGIPTSRPSLLFNGIALMKY